jgi:aminotransferase
MESFWFLLTQAVAGFMGQVMQGSISFCPSQIVLTCGATPAMEILSFCIADPGNAFLVPSPYYPGYVYLLSFIFILCPY